VSTPIITNRAPAPGEIVGVADAVGFSARDRDAEVIRSSLNYHIGAGPAFWEGGVLPEDDPQTEFILKARVGKPKNFATRTLLGSGAVQIDKIAVNQEAIYEWGKLQSPADPSDPLMVEFTLELPEASLSTDGTDYTGVLVGLYINNTGVAIKFFTDFATRSIEIHNIDNSATSAPSPTYEVNYDWDQAVPHTYKLLWQPALDQLRLYVSVGQENTNADILLIDGKVSDFPSTLPDNEIPPVQPVAFFGHGLATTFSTSIWYNAYLYNLVNTALVGGFLAGEQTGFLRTDEVVDYRMDALPRKAERPWILLPDSFGSIDGNSFITTDRRLQIFRQTKTDSYGYYRIEPKVEVGASVIDIRLSGRTISLDPSLGQATGMEVYIDDGTKRTVLAFLDDLGTQYIGFLDNATSPELLGSYQALLASWLNDVTYRLSLEPGVGSQLSRFVLTDDGWDSEIVGFGTYASLPSSLFPGPGLGFLHNANTIEALAEMKIARARYSTDVRYLSGSSLPTAQGWTKSATSQDATSDGTLLTIDDVSESEALYYYLAEPDLDETKGFFVEFRARVDAYEKNGLFDPIRELTGVGIEVDDGGEIYRLMFAEGGPELGKILFLGVNDDVEQNLLDIRAGLDYVQGTYAQVDWSTSRIYRLEKTVGGTLRLYVDLDELPSIELEVPVSNLPTTTSGPEIRFGNLLTAWKSTSVWKWIYHNLSAGFDVSSFTLTSENEVLSRFDHAINVIAEAES